MVTLDAFDAAGNPTGSAIVSLGPQEVRLLDQLQGSANEAGGYVRITSHASDLCVAVLWIIGLVHPGRCSTSLPHHGEPGALKPHGYRQSTVTVNPAAVTKRLAGARPDQTSGSGAIAFPSALSTSASFNGITVAADAASGLMAAYGFNEGSGSVTSDASGDANTATLNSAGWTTGKFGNSVSFNGSSSFVEAPDINALTPERRRHLKLGVYLNDAPAEIASVLNKWSQTLDDEYLLGINPNRTLFFAWQTTRGGAYGSTSYGDARVSASWDGLKAAWASNYGYDGSPGE